MLKPEGIITLAVSAVGPPSKMEHITSADVWGVTYMLKRGGINPSGMFAQIGSPRHSDVYWRVSVADQSDLILDSVVMRREDGTAHVVKTNVGDGDFSADELVIDDGVTFQVFTQVESFQSDQTTLELAVAFETLRLNSHSAAVASVAKYMHEALGGKPSIGLIQSLYGTKPASTAAQGVPSAN